jgi:hypothetical protein
LKNFLLYGYLLAKKKVQPSGYLLKMHIPEKKLQVISQTETFSKENKEMFL